MVCPILPPNDLDALRNISLMRARAPLFTDLASVFVAKSTTWFELFWIPVAPLSSKQIWLCGICQWKIAYAQGYVLEPRPSFDVY